MIRALLGKLYGEDAAEATTIQYGGSMNAKNAAGLWRSRISTAGSLAALR